MKIEMGNAMKIWIGNKENLQYVSKIIADDWRSIYLELYSHNMVQGNIEIDDLAEEEFKKIICEETADKYDAVLVEYRYNVITKDYSTVQTFKTLQEAKECLYEEIIKYAGIHEPDYWKIVPTRVVM